MRFKETRKIAAAIITTACLRALDRDVLEGGGVGEILNKAELPERRINGSFGEDLLHLVKDRRALLVVELNRLLLVERIDVGVVAIDIGAALHDKSFQSGRGVAESTTAAKDQVLELFVRVCLD